MIFAFIKKNNYKVVYQIIAFCLPFLVYVFTLAPSVLWIDSDELAAVCTLLKIAHPTGYPLFTILGKIFTFIPVSDEVYRLNLLSAALSSAALVIFFNLLIFLFKDYSFKKSFSRKGDEKISEKVLYNAALASTLILAFSKTFWDNANVIEVYSLQSLFFILNIFLFLQAINSEKTYYDFSLWIISAYVLGMSFANQMATFFLIPGFLYLYFYRFGLEKYSVRQILILLIPFLLGMSLYIYLFVRADNSVLSWGSTHNFENFWNHITGKQYSDKMFVSFDNFKSQLSRFFKEYPMEFSYLGLIFIISGLIELKSKNSQLFYFTLISFSFCVLIASNYSILDINSYFLLAIIVSAVWFFFGIIFILSRLKKSSVMISYTFIFIFIIALTINFSSLDKSKEIIVKDYAYNIFNSAPQNSIVISTYLPVLYFQNVKGVRKDIIFLNRDFLFDNWYLNSFIKSYPDVYNKSKNEFDVYSIELEKLNNNKSRYTSPQTNEDNKNILRFQKTYRDLVNSIIEKNINEKTILTTLEIDEDNNEKIAEDYFKIPNGVLLKLSKDSSFVEAVSPELKYRVDTRNDYFTNFIMSMYYKSHVNLSKYLLNNSRKEEAQSHLQKALELKPDSKELQNLLKK